MAEMTGSKLSTSEITARKIAFVLDNETEALDGDPNHPGFAVFKIRKAQDVIPKLFDVKLLEEGGLLGVRVERTPVMSTERVENDAWYRNEADTLVRGYDEREYIDHYDIAVKFTDGKRKTDAWTAAGKLYLNTEAVNDKVLDSLFRSGVGTVNKLAGPRKQKLQKIFNDAAEIERDFTVEAAVDPAFSKKLRDFINEMEFVGQETGITEIVDKKTYYRLLSRATNLRIC